VTAVTFETDVHERIRRRLKSVSDEVEFIRGGEIEGDLVKVGAGSDEVI